MNCVQYFLKEIVPDLLSETYIPQSELEQMTEDIIFKKQNPSE
jgi:putative hydrolase of HD superfamily